MKKILPFLLIFISYQMKAQWSGALMDSLTHNGSRDEVNHQCIDIDQSNMLHVVYARANPSTGWGIYYKKRDNNSVWSAEDTVSQQVCYHPVIAASKIPGEAYIAYEGTASSGEEIFVCSDSGGTWNCQQLTSDSAGNITPAIDIDSSGYLHLAWISTDSAGDYKIKYATNRSGSWVIQTLSGSQLGIYGSGASPDIAVDKSGRVHIAYRGDNGTVYRIHHAYNNNPGGTVWNYDIITTPNDEDFSCAIKIDDAINVHLVVSGDDGFGFPVKAFYLKKSFSSISFSSPTGVAPSYSGSVGDIYVDNSGIPHFILNEISGNIYTGNIIYADSNNWGGMTLLNSGDIYEGNLVMDDQNHAYLAAYRGNTYPDEEIIVYGYETNVGINKIDKKEIPYKIISSENSLNILFGENYSGRIFCTSVDGRIVFDQNKNYTKGDIVTINNLPAGIYIFNAENKSGKYIQKVIVE